MDQVNTGSGYGSSPVRCQSITWINAGLLSIGPIKQVSVKFESEFYHFHSRKCIWQFRRPKWRPFSGQNDDHFLQGEMIKISLVGLGLYINKLKYVCHCVHITNMLTAEIDIAHGLCRTISNTARHCLKCTSITLDGVGKHSKHSFGPSMY